MRGHKDRRWGCQTTFRKCVCHLHSSNGAERVAEEGERHASVERWAKSFDHAVYESLEARAMWFSVARSAARWLHSEDFKLCRQLPVSKRRCGAASMRKEYQAKAHVRRVGRRVEGLQPSRHGPLHVVRRLRVFLRSFWMRRAWPAISALHAKPPRREFDSLLRMLSLCERCDRTSKLQVFVPHALPLLLLPQPACTRASWAAYTSPL